MAAHVKQAGATLERYLHHWRERGALMKSPVKPHVAAPLTITISMEKGVGGANIAQQLAQQLDWPVYDRELVEKISADTGVESQLLESLDEKAPHWLAESLAAFSKEKSISGSGYAIRLLKILFAIHGHGNSIIVGRGAAQVLPERATLRVRLFAPLEDRIENMHKVEGIDIEQARKQLEEVDSERAAFVKGYFHKDISDQHGYDLLINPLKLGADHAVELILQAKTQLVDSQSK